MSSLLYVWEVQLTVAYAEDEQHLDSRFSCFTAEHVCREITLRLQLNEDASHRHVFFLQKYSHSLNLFIFCCVAKKRCKKCKKKQVQVLFFARHHVYFVLVLFYQPSISSSFEIILNHVFHLCYWLDILVLCPLTK